MKNGRPATRSTCTECGTKKFRIGVLGLRFALNRSDSRHPGAFMAPDPAKTIRLQ